MRSDLSNFVSFCNQKYQDKKFSNKTLNFSMNFSYNNNKYCNTMLKNTLDNNLKLINTNTNRTSKQRPQNYLQYKKYQVTYGNTNQNKIK